MEGIFFFQWLHTLVLMGDAVLLATTKCDMMKIITLDRITAKAKFFVIGGTVNGSEALVVNGLTVEHCQTYVYLRSLFTSDGSVSSTVSVHANTKCHMLWNVLPL